MLLQILKNQLIPSLQEFLLTCFFLEVFLEIFRKVWDEMIREATCIEIIKIDLR